jgi:hypothetical protein
MKQLCIIFIFSFSFINARGQEHFYPSLSTMMSTLYKIDSINFKVSADGGRTFGEWKSWPNKFIYISFENIDLQNVARRSGYPNAFVAAFKNNTRSFDLKLFK